MHKRLLCALCVRDVVRVVWEILGDVGEKSRERMSNADRRLNQTRAGKVPSAGPRAGQEEKKGGRVPRGCTFSRPLVSLRSV